MKLKVLFSMAVFSAIVAGSAYAADPGCEYFSGTVHYECVAQRLEAINSDIFTNLSNSEIDALLTECGDGGHEAAVVAARACQ